MLVGAFHNYLEDMLEEWGDLLGSTLEDLSPILRRYVAVQVHRRLAGAIGEYSEEAVGDEGNQKKFLSTVSDTAGWIIDPKILAGSASRPKLEGFFRQWGSQAVERALTQFRHDGTKFFTWLSCEHDAYADYFTRLDSAILVRNQIAHGTVGTRLTIEDVRRHRATISMLVIKAEQFVGAALQDARAVG
jgi:hypothetical protein